MHYETRMRDMHHDGRGEHRGPHGVGRQEHGGHSHHDGGGGHFGRGMGRHPRGGHFGEGVSGSSPYGGRDRARRGEARYVLLDALRDGPKHGYEIIKALEEKSGGQYSPSPGTVYPTMQYLEDQGLVRADQEAERRVYHLTEAGRLDLDAHAQDLADFWKRFSGAPQAESSRPDLRLLEDAIDDLSRTIWRGVKRTENAATIKRVRQTVEQCQTAVRELLVEAESGGQTEAV